MCTRRADEPLTGCYRTPWGEGTVTVAHGRLAAVELPGPGTAGAVEHAGRTGAAATPEQTELLARWVGELEAYFRGERLSWTAEEVGLGEMGLNDFETAVYAALLSVPAAVTVSYGDLAEMAGFPRAARAVGNAMAANPVPVIIPCHRVIRADGSLGHYGNDPAWKERLLEHEHVHSGGGRS